MATLYPSPEPAPPAAAGQPAAAARAPIGPPPGVDPKDWHPLGYTQTRSCTDILFLVLFVLFWVLMLAVAAVGFSNGNLRRLYRGTDTLGNVCGVDGQARQPTDAHLAQLGQGPWAEMKNIWYPISPEMFTADGSVADLVKTMLKLGICVKECPAEGSTLRAYSGIDWPVYYKSKPTFRRCVPSNSTGIYDEVQRQLGAGKLKKAIEEVVGAARVITIAFFMAFVVCFVLVALMRWLAGPLVYIVLLLTVLAVGGLGIGLWFQGMALQTDDAESNNYAVAFKVSAIVAWVATFLYVLLLVWMFKRIRIAVEILELAAEVMSKVPTLVFVPPVMLLCSGVLALWCLLVWGFLQTSAKLELTSIPVRVSDTQWVNATAAFLQEDHAKDWLSLVNLFGFLWTNGLFNAFAFMVLAFVGVWWYFSDPLPGDNKVVPPNAVVRAASMTFRYHLGTLAFGSLIIAILQLLRWMLAKVQRRMEAARANDAVRYCLCCVQCLLACWERLLKFISRNAYIVTCIEGTNFCRSAHKALDVILDNLVQVAAANLIADWVFNFLKVCIIAVNVLISYLLLAKTPLGSEVEMMYVPLTVVAFITWMIANLYMHIFDCLQDTILLCFCYDKEKNNGADRPYYFSESLSKLLEKYNMMALPTQQKQEELKLLPAN